MKPKLNRSSPPLPTVLLIGPLPIDDDVIGGTKVLFANLVKQLRERKNFNVEVINSSRSSRAVSTGLRGRLLDASKLFKVLCLLWVRLRTSHVIMWNASSSGAILAAPFIHGMCSMRRRPLILRLFGGDFEDCYRPASLIKRWVIEHTVFKSSLLLLESRGSVATLESRAPVEWFPNTRNMGARKSPRPGVCQRFLYMGQLRPQKGIDEILWASDRLPEGLDVTIVGPLMEGVSESDLQNRSNIRYLGSVTPDKVPAILEDHHCLLLPSYYDGEGIPGVIIEAMQLGLPTITTKWKLLPELVGHEQNGLLIPVRDPRELLDAMLRMNADTDLFGRLQEKAVERGEFYRDVNAVERLEAHFQRLATGASRCAG